MAPGSMIVFNPAVFTTPTTIALSSGLGQLELSALVTIEEPAARVTVSELNSNRVFSLDAGVAARMSGVSITRGSTTGSGGGIYAGPRSSLVLDNCTISASSAKRGAGLYGLGDGSLADCTMAGNYAAGIGGGVNVHSGSVGLADCKVSGDSAGGHGGGIPAACLGTPPSVSCGVVPYHARFSLARGCERLDCGKAAWALEGDRGIGRCDRRNLGLGCAGRGRSTSTTPAADTLAESCPEEVSLKMSSGAGRDSDPGASATRLGPVAASGLRMFARLLAQQNRDESAAV
jgi:hypothetical protein